MENPRSLLGKPSGAVQDGIYDRFKTGAGASSSVEQWAADGTTEDRITAALNFGGVFAAVATDQIEILPGG